MNLFIILLGMFLGGLMVLNRTANMLLGKSVGIYASNLINHLTGTAGSTAIFICVVLLGVNGTSGVGLPPWYALLGGFIGSGFVVLSNYTLCRTGVVTSTILLLAGQFISSLLIDIFVLHIRISLINIIGAGIISLGIILYNYTPRGNAEKSNCSG